MVLVPQSSRDPSRSARAVRVAIIVPAYRQPGLLIEALDTALAQQTDFAYVIVVVNDGCPFDETDHVCREFASANPDRIYYLHKRNGGLSAARNTGIDFVLAAFPALEGVYFLDADNRIQPCLLQRLFNSLQDAGPEIGWAYPDVDKFGFSEFCDTSGPYSPLEHLFRNFCEAGSMAARRMLDAGVRFDETMRQGSEDWEFWLQGLEHGFRGVHVLGAGFRYRRRGESTLVKSERNYRPILEYIRARHQRLFDIRALMRLEAAVSRRYAVYFPDREIVRCITDVDDGGEEIRVDALVTHLLHSLVRPDYGRCPSHVIVMHSALFHQLCAHRLLKAVLWIFERMMLRCTLVTCRVALDDASSERGAAWQGEAYPLDLKPAETTAAGDAHVAGVHAQTLVNSLETQASNGLRFDHEPQKPYHEARLVLRLRLPGDPPSPRPGASDALAYLHAVAARTWTRDECSGWSAAQIDHYRRGIAMPADFYHSVHRVSSVLPLCSSGPTRQVALAIDSARSAVTLAAVASFVALLCGQGWRIHLAGLGSGPLSWSDDSHKLFASIIPLPLSLATPEPAMTSRDAYLGTPIPRTTGSDCELAVDTLAGFDIVISVENNFAHGLMGRLRDLRVETWALLGTAESVGRAAEVVNACAAFEHAYQMIVVLNAKTLRLCRALGLPPEKLRRWSEVEVSNDDDWCACLPVSLPTSFASNLSADNRS